MARWQLLAREPAPSFALNNALPIVSVRVIRRHLGVSTAVVVTPWTEDAARRLQPGCGVSVRRNKVEEFAGPIERREISYDSDGRRFLISLSCVGDEVIAADTPVFPDPARAPDDQTVNDYWTTTAPISTALLRLLGDQLGPGAHPTRRVAGLTVAEDPGLGTSRLWQAPLFASVMDTAAQFSVASGENLGVRIAPQDGGLRASVYEPRDLAAGVQFSVDLANLVGFTYVDAAPSITDALSAGQGDLHARLRRYAATTSTRALSWKRRIWKVIDRRDTADVADLDQANSDAIADGDATVSLTFELTDTQASRYGVVWGLGDVVTVHVGFPRHARVASVADVVREVYLDVDETGKETVRPAVGTADAKSVIPGPDQQALDDVSRRLSGLERRK